MRQLATMAITLLALSSGCAFDVSGTPPDTQCGDGVAEPGEACDGADLAGESCETLGQGDGTLACRTDCQFDTSGCAGSSVCGDGVIDPGAGEQCDDGNTEPCDDCDENCQLEICGNSVTDCGEQCDDGNTLSGDGCSAECLAEIQPTCGNGAIEGGEQCDDGGVVSCDGCSSTCRIEACDNGVLDCGETCEVGQINSTCEQQGFPLGGTLGCAPGCQGFDTTLCLRANGEPCTGGQQCVGSICLSEQAQGFPAGLCTSDCTTQACDPDELCVDYGGGPRCYEACTTSASCRPGYTCRAVLSSSTDTVCLPLCADDTVCTDTGNCNVYQSLCQADPLPGERVNGGACDSHADCRGYCWLWPTNGYCRSSCQLSNPSCPGNDICSDVNPDLGDMGFCLRGCQTNADCPRGNYTCQPNPYPPGGTICWF